MARTTLKSQAIIIAQLEAQVAELTTEKGILLSEVTMLQSELAASKEVIARQGQVIAARPKSAPPVAPRKPATKPLPSPAQVEVEPAIQITDRDKIVYAKFQALPRDQKQAYYDFAHSNGFGHLGIHNVNEIRVAFLAAKEAVA